MNNYGRLLPIATKAVMLAADMMLHRSPGALTTKGDRDFASELDYDIEREIRSFLETATPDIGFLGEEEGAKKIGEDMRWVLDPIDGTANFVRGIPLCAVSLGLIHGNEAVLGVIQLPFLHSCYAATKGGGATANGRPIKVSRTNRLSEAIVAIGDYAVGTNSTAKNRTRLSLTAQLAETAQRVRMTGTAALDLAWLADGKIDAAITLSNQPWDMTAGVAIAREAGATVIDSDGSAHSISAATTWGMAPGLISEIGELISKCSEPLHHSEIASHAPDS
ncbi:inositol monophosphatase family protein [Micromonospora olivasterospora]|nr:inositol monophosphatase family protein [Micromonospora olivasterospora]